MAEVEARHQGLDGAAQPGQQRGHAAGEVAGLEVAALGAHPQHLEAGFFQHRGQRAPREVDQVHFHIPGPPAAHQPRKEAVNIHRVDDEGAARLQHVPGRAQRLVRRGDVFDDIPHRHHAEMGGGEPGLFQRAQMHWQAARARLLHRPRARVYAAGVPAVAAGDFDEDAGVGAHVQQPPAFCRADEPGHWFEVLLKGEDAALAFFEVEGVFDGFVDFQHLALRRARGGVDEAAVLAAHDGAVAAIAAAGAGVGSPLAARRFRLWRQRGGDVDDVIIGAAEITAHGFQRGRGGRLHSAGPRKRFLASRRTV